MSTRYFATHWPTRFGSFGILMWMARLNQDTLMITLSRQGSMQVAFITEHSRRVRRYQPWGESFIERYRRLHP